MNKFLVLIFLLSSQASLAYKNRVSFLGSGLGYSSTNLSLSAGAILENYKYEKWLLGYGGFLAFSGGGADFGPQGSAKYFLEGFDEDGFYGLVYSNLHYSTKNENIKLTLAVAGSHQWNWGVAKEWFASAGLGFSTHSVFIPLEIGHRF